MHSSANEEGHNKFVRYVKYESCVSIIGTAIDVLLCNEMSDRERFESRRGGKHMEGFAPHLKKLCVFDFAHSSRERANYDLRQQLGQ